MPNICIKKLTINTAKPETINQFTKKYLIINKMFKEPIFDCLTGYYKNYLKEKFYYTNEIKSVYNNEYQEITKRIRLELTHDEDLYYKTLAEIDTIINKYQIIIKQHKK